MFPYNVNSMIGLYGLFAVTLRIANKRVLGSDALQERMLPEHCLP